MLDVYTKMTADSFKTQLQPVLTADYEDIKGIQGGSCCAKPKIVENRFEDPLNRRQMTAQARRHWTSPQRRPQTRQRLLPPGRSFQLPQAQQERRWEGSGSLLKADAN
jgi:hypothetical protein